MFFIYILLFLWLIDRRKKTISIFYNINTENQNDYFFFKKKINPEKLSQLKFLIRAALYWLVFKSTSTKQKVCHGSIGNYYKQKLVHGEDLKRKKKQKTTKISGFTAMVQPLTGIPWLGVDWKCLHCFPVNQLANEFIRHLGRTANVQSMLTAALMNYFYIVAQTVSK